MVVEPLVVALLLAAALMHATWNALLKADRSDRLATFGVIMTTGTLMGVIAVPFLPKVEYAAWKYLAASVIIHVAYYTFLLKAYSYGDLSHTYPIARGLGPLLVAMVSGQMIGEHLRVQDIAGVVLLSAGLVALALPLKGVVAAPGGRHGLATLFAVLTGITIAAYIIADGMGVRSAGPDFQHRLAYIAWLCVLEGPWLLVLAIVLRPQTVWSHLRRTWWRGVIGGVIANTGYGIAIYALVLGPMAHVAALRETSVLFGALMGTLLLSEPFGRRRVVAAAVIVCGLVLMNGPKLF
ncbi:MAG: EamA family transporter [Reyranella sp.]|uniref:EamA family transporter n=1 Tax=Reyranella sp. TaxID=1929291 RepID=UPI001AC79C93|nr:EamA family transporter [Reyranella sp.]MBN9087230.1 EamA family transporter [Reyranella sp.]